jgi:bacillithiol synthase
VYIEATTSPLFLLNNGRRLTLKLRDGNFVTKERTYSASELQSRAADLSPNALLRPVMQDYLLPTVAYVGGPAEVAYMAQSEVLYRELLGRMPVILPRNGFTLLDQRSWKLLHRYDLQVNDLFDHQDRVRARMAERLVPAGLRSGMNEARSATEAILSDLRLKLGQFDPTLAAAAQKSGGKILYQFGKLARKAANETMRRDARATADAQFLSDLVYPHRHLQERLYSILPFLAKHGTDIMDRLLENTQLDCPDHMIRVL